MTFNALSPVSPQATDEEKKATRAENRRKTLENLVKQLPGEATGVYLMGLDVFKGNVAWLTVAMACGAIVLVLVRIGLKSTTAILSTSLVAYLLWVYAIGDGPIQALMDYLTIEVPAGAALFLISFWTTVVTIAANFGWIK
jgi:hypothetical protein